FPHGDRARPPDVCLSLLREAAASNRPGDVRAAGNARDGTEPYGPDAAGAGAERSSRDDPGPGAGGSDRAGYRRGHEASGRVHVPDGAPSAFADRPWPARPGTARPPHRQQILRPPAAVPLRAHAGPLRRDPDAEYDVRLAGTERRVAAAAVGTAACPGA